MTTEITLKLAVSLFQAYSSIFVMFIVYWWLKRYIFD